jgi:hypothetical protein
MSKPLQTLRASAPPRENEPAPRSKIARLPFELRETLNGHLLDNKPGRWICDWVNIQPQAKAIFAEFFGGEPLNAENLSQWRQGGYQNWLSKRDHFAALTELTEIAKRTAKATGGNVADAAAEIAGGKLLALLDSMSEDDAETFLAAFAKYRAAEAAALSAKTNVVRTQNQSAALALAQQKFQRETARLFLEWFEDKRAREIAAGKGEPQIKMDQLVKLMFGEKPK